MHPSTGFYPPLATTNAKPSDPGSTPRPRYAASLLKRQLTFDVPEIKNVSMDLEDGSRINWGEACDGGRRLRAIQHGASSGLDASALVPVPEIRKQRQEQTSILL